MSNVKPDTDCSFMHNTDCSFMHNLIYHNNQMVDVAQTRISPTSAAVLYGWGVFTNLQIYDGKAFAFERHWNRLVSHAEKARLAVAIDLKHARTALEKLIIANSVEQGRARITLLKGETGSGRSESEGDSQLLMFTSPEVSSARNDLSLTLSPYRVLSTALLAGVKQTAMLENLFALDEARSRHFNEAVLLNERGEIVSATSANIFWVEGDEVFTPSIATGCVSGITRHFIHEIAVRWKLHLVEGSFPIQRLLDAREVFLTSTAREVSLVTSFDAKQYNHKQARISKLISREFQKITRNAKIEE
jgi:branched-subunit amino acid aminotransferase/4-amino-4-deoxychorismate lyase